MMLRQLLTVAVAVATCVSTHITSSEQLPAHHEPHAVDYENVWSPRDTNLTELEREWEEIKVLNMTETPTTFQDALQSLQAPGMAQRVHEVAQLVEQYWSVFSQYVHNVSQAVVTPATKEYFSNVTHAIVPDGSWQYFKNVSRAIYPDEARELLRNMTLNFDAGGSQQSNTNNSTLDGTQHILSSKEEENDHVTFVTLRVPRSKGDGSTTTSEDDDDTYSSDDEETVSVRESAHDHDSVPTVVTDDRTEVAERETVVSVAEQAELPDAATARNLTAIGVTADHDAANLILPVARGLPRSTSIVMKLQTDSNGFVVSPIKLNGRLYSMLVSTLSDRTWAVLPDLEFDQLLIQQAETDTAAARDALARYITVRTSGGVSLTGTLMKERLTLGVAPTTTLDDVSLVLLKRSSFGSNPPSEGLVGFGLPLRPDSLLNQLYTAGFISSTRMGYFKGDQLVLGDLKLTWEALSEYKWAHSTSRNAWVIAGQVALAPAPVASSDALSAAAAAYIADAVGASAASMTVGANNTFDVNFSVRAVLDSGSPYLVVPRGQFVSLMHAWIPATIRPFCSINSETRLFQCPCALATQLPDVLFTLDNTLRASAQPATQSPAGTRRLNSEETLLLQLLGAGLTLDSPLGSRLQQEQLHRSARPPENWQIPPPTIAPQNRLHEEDPEDIQLKAAEQEAVAVATTTAPLTATVGGVQRSKAGVVTAVVGSPDLSNTYRIRASTLYASQSLHSTPSTGATPSRGHRGAGVRHNERSLGQYCSLLIVPGEDSALNSSVPAAWTFGAPVLRNFDVVLDPESFVVGIRQPLALNAFPVRLPNDNTAPTPEAMIAATNVAAAGGAAAAPAFLGSKGFGEAARCVSEAATTLPQGKYGGVTIAIVLVATSAMALIAAAWRYCLRPYALRRQVQNVDIQAYGEQFDNGTGNLVSNYRRMDDADH